MPINKVINKGTNAGGANTNANGIPYEELTNLDDKLTIIKTYNFSKKIKFNNNDKLFIKTGKSNFMKCLKDEIDINVHQGHGCKAPDECYIDK